MKNLAKYSEPPSIIELESGGGVLRIELIDEILYFEYTKELRMMVTWKSKVNLEKLEENDPTWSKFSSMS
jgi:hypothetical protein